MPREATASAAGHHLTQVLLGNRISDDYKVAGAGQTVARSVSCGLGGRKVRTPQGGVPRNAGGP